MEISSKTGLLLFGHGARDPRWSQPLEAIAAHIRAMKPETPLQLAYLEFMSPDLHTAGATLAAQGCRQVQVVPLFLGVGGHVRKDLPELMSRLRAAHPMVNWVLAPAAGEAPAVVAALAGFALSQLDTEAEKDPVS